MIWIVLLLTLLAPLVADAATGSSGVDTWYARPSTDCPNNGDGLSYACAAGAGQAGAFSNASGVVWTATVGVDNGDTLYICGEHTVSFALPSGTAGTKSAPIMIDYRCPDDSGSINKVVAMTEAQTGGNWTDEGGSLWYLSVASYTWKDPRRIWIDDLEIFPASVKAALGTNEGTGAPSAQFWYDSGNSRIYLFSGTNPSTTFSTMESLVAGSASCDYAPLCITSTSSEYITIINPVHYGGHLAGLYLIGADHITVYGTEADDSACLILRNSRGIFITDNVGNGTGIPSTYIHVHDCTVDAQPNPSFQNYNWEWNMGNGDGVALMYSNNDVLIESNTVRNYGHVLIQMSATLGTGIVTRNIARNNTLICTTPEYCRCISFDGATLGRATLNSYIGNTCDGQSIRSQINGDRNFIIGNVWKNQKRGTVDPAATQFVDFEGFAATVSANNVFRNNTMMNNPYGPCISFRAGTNTKSGFIVENNVLHECGGDEFGAGASLYIQDHANVGDQTFRNNLISHSTETNTVHYKATGLTTVSGFDSACTGDVCSGNLSSNPLFSSATDLRLTEGSPAYRVGAVGVCEDVRGRVCPPDAPNLGAYQSTSGDPAATRAVRN